MTTPAVVNLEMRQGNTWTKQLVWKTTANVPINLTGYSARMQIRRGIKNPEFLAELTTVNNKIVLGGSLGTITLKLAASETSLLPAKECVYDLELQSPDGTVVTLVEGSVSISPEITR